MKWYFASRTKHKEKINYLQESLKGFKQEISFDWTKLNEIKPYFENREKCREYSKSISKAIKNSDVFVMFSDKEGTDMFIEKGIAISSNMDKGIPRVYVVGKYNNRSMMHFHPSIKRVDSIEDVFLEEIPRVLKNTVFSKI